MKYLVRVFLFALLVTTAFGLSSCGSSDGTPQISSSGPFLTAGITTLTGTWVDEANGDGGSFYLPISSSGAINGGQYSNAFGGLISEAVTGQLQASGAIAFNIPAASGVPSGFVGTWTGTLNQPITSTLTGSVTTPGGDTVYVVFTVNSSNTSVTTQSQLAGTNYVGFYQSTDSQGNTSYEPVAMMISSSGAITGSELYDQNGVQVFGTLGGTEIAVPGHTNEAALSYEVTVHGGVVLEIFQNFNITSTEDTTAGLPASEMDVNELQSSSGSGNSFTDALLSETGYFGEGL